MTPHQTLFWSDALKGALIAAIPFLALDWALLQPQGAGFVGVFFVTAGVVLVPLMLFAAAALVLFLLLRRRPGWLLGPVLMLLLNGAFLQALR